MEDILDSKDDENLINLFRLKNRVYNETFKSYIFIFKQIKNINFSSKIKYEDIDFTTIILDKNINNPSFQDNISMSFDTLDFLNDELNEKTQKLKEIIAISICSNKATVLSSRYSPFTFVNIGCSSC